MSFEGLTRVGIVDRFPFARVYSPRCVLRAHWVRNLQQRASEPENPGGERDIESRNDQLIIKSGQDKTDPESKANTVEAAPAVRADIDLGQASPRDEPAEPTEFAVMRAPGGAIAEPVAGTAPAELNKSAIQAHVDGIDSRGNITGWGWVPARPEQHLDVNAYIGEEVVSFGTANLPRTDVKEAGYGDGSYGFSLPLLETLLDGKSRQFSIRFEATGGEQFSIETELRPPFLAGRGLSVGRQSEAAVPRMATLPVGAETTPAGAVYVPGQYVICTMPYPRPPYHSEGWYDPEEEFTWIRGIEAVIEMLLRRPAGMYTFTLEVVPNGVGGKLQTLEIFFNYFRVGLFEVARAMTVSVELPAEIFILRKTRINLVCRNAVTPSDHGIPDDRRLGIAIRGWCIA